MLINKLKLSTTVELLIKRTNSHSESHRSPEDNITIDQNLNFCIFECKFVFYFVLLL